MPPVVVMVVTPAPVAWETMPAPLSLVTAPVVVTPTEPVPLLTAFTPVPTEWMLVAVTLIAPAPEAIVALTPVEPTAAPAPTVPARPTVTEPLADWALTPSPLLDSRSPVPAVTVTAPEPDAISCTASRVPPLTVTPAPRVRLSGPLTVRSWMPPLVPVTLALAV